MQVCLQIENPLYLMYVTSAFNDLTLLNGWQDIWPIKTFEYLSRGSILERKKKTYGELANQGLLGNGRDSGNGA